MPVRHARGAASQPSPRTAADTVTTTSTPASGDASAPAPVDDSTFERPDARARRVVGDDGRVPMPAWLEGAVVYGVVPTLFGGEPFKDVAKKLDYLKDQGVDALWLSPINETDDPSAISYSVTDYFSVRDDFGTKRDLKALIKGAHDRGMKVLMDFVPNHTSSEHPFFKDAVERGEDSPYYDWYARDADGNPTHYFDWESLKNLNYEHPEVQKMMVDAFSFWVKDMGIDGFRVDAAWGVKERNPAFWSKLEKEMSAIRPDVFMLAEASARDPYYTKNGFDAAYDWTKSLGKWAWEKAFDEPEKIGPRLHKALAAKETPLDRVARFLNNNDTGERFITKHGPEVSRVAATLLHTLPGIPVVYTGDEVGAEFEPYEDPPPISWDDPHKLKPHYAKLAELREALPALAKGDFEGLPFSNHGAGYGFLRDAGGTDKALVLLNFGDDARVRFRLPPEMKALLDDGKLVDALTGERVALKQRARGVAEVELKKHASLVLVPKTP